MNLYVSIFILCGIYLVELACYQLGIRILFEVRHKSYFWMAAGLVCPVVIGLLPMEAIGKNTLVTVCTIGVMFLSLDQGMVERGIKIVLTLILLECFADILTYPCDLINEYLDNDYVDSFEYFISKCFIMAGVYILSLIKKLISQYKRERLYSEIYLVIGIIAASMMLCLTALNHAKIYTNNEKFIIFCSILNIAINISILLLVLFVIYIKSTHERMERLLRTEQLLKESQVHYYKQALKKEEDTRKYWHDMMSHLAYVMDILDKNRVQDAKAYVTDMLGGFQKIQSTYYVTGNEMVDIIMNYYFAMLPEDTKVIIEDRCPVDFALEDTEVCTIFSNIFQNAVEEITENSIKNAKIIVTVQKGKKYAGYHIKNSLISATDKIPVNKNGLPQSHKPDKKNHGIGMANVKKAVERNHGRFEWYQEKEYFGISIILPIKDFSN